jgi:hypothetical protein
MLIVPVAVTYHPHYGVPLSEPSGPALVILIFGLIWSEEESLTEEDRAEMAKPVTEEEIKSVVD